MAETTTSTNGIPDSTTMSTLESNTHIPIAQLSPLLPASGSRSLKAVVTLTWPYSSRTGSVAFLLAEPDFRLRRTRGQVRVQFSGSSANAVAKSGITSGDEVILCLDGAEYVELEPPNATPGRGVEFELKFKERLLLQFRPEDSQDVKIINIDHPSPEPVVAPTSVLATETEAETEGQIPEMPSTPVPFSNRVINNSEEYFSPVFLKRERISYGSMFEEGYDPFEEGDGSVRGRGRKRTRLSTTWRFTSRSPSPSPEVEEPVAAPSEHDIQEPASQPVPAMTDEGVQTMVEETVEIETGVSAEVTPALEQIQLTIVDKIKVNGIVQAVDPEVPVQGKPQIEEATTVIMPPPEKQSDLTIPEVEEQQNPPDNADEKRPYSPQLRPLPSEGLPLVSPLVTGQIEMFNHHIHNDHNEDLDNPNAPAVYSAEADLPEQDDQIDADEDPHSVRPGSHMSNQPNSDQTTYQTSAILSGDELGSPSMETTSTPHTHGEFEAGEGAEQFFPHHNISGSDPYTSAHVYAETPGEQGRYVHGGLEEDMAQYNYPDPEEIHPQSNNWGTQSSGAYPDLDNSHQSASHSVYSQQPSMSSMVRSQSNQSHQSLQSHQSPKSQPVDLTESSDEDEDAEGYPEVEDNSQQYVSSSHLPVGHGEERSHDEGEEYEDNTYDSEDKVDEYGEGYSDEYDGNMELRGRDDYLEEDDNGSENDYVEDNYSEDEMNNEAPLQQHPPREPEVIDLLSSDDEDGPGSPVAQIGDDIEDDEELESGQESEEYEDQEEDEDGQNLDVVGEEIKNDDIPTTNFQGPLRESPDVSVEDESMGIESTLVNKHNDSIKPGTQMPEILSNASGSGFEAQVYVNLSRGESRGAQQSPPSQGSSEEEATTDLDYPEPMDVETSLDNTSAATATDNLDGLFKKLEEAESETQVEQGPSNIRRAIPQNVAVDAEYAVEDFGNEGNVQNPDGANADETNLQETQPSEPTEYPPTIIEISHGPIQCDNSENIINAALEISLPSPIAVEVSNASTIPNSTEQSIKDRAAKSGWANLPKKDTLFSRTFGIDGANDAGEDTDEDKNGQISYPILPVTEPEDQQELIGEPEQISQSHNPTHGIQITTNHENGQLPTPDDTQMMNLDEDTFTSMSDLVQFQLQEEMGEMDEDSEMMHTAEGNAKDQSTNSVDDEDQSSFQEAINEDQDVSPETDALNRDDDEAIEPKLEDFEVEFTHAEVTEIRKTEIIETELEHADKNPVEDDFAREEEVEDVELEVDEEEGEEVEKTEVEVEDVELR
ncbi:8dac0915-0fd9-4341-833b-f3f4db050a0a [Sclerotinia trifoliorum]|uniref:8dac0915-0fd9-4341-833b-f3f4db050a0a n=1 Tax=Sclerotinia trifoliorum TaxID=28548 RepID=A0A8H2ZUT2_9HELO|nr:8dac0915-0fd9-4341-833b-f3f4db050a0a [Sclerotinia trifoliorum]